MFGSLASRLQCCRGNDHLYNHNRRINIFHRQYLKTLINRSKAENVPFDLGFHSSCEVILDAFPLVDLEIIHINSGCLTADLIRIQFLSVESWLQRRTLTHIELFVQNAARHSVFCKGEENRWHVTSNCYPLIVLYAVLYQFIGCVNSLFRILTATHK